jgi:hypothetical protein
MAQAVSQPQVITPESVPVEPQAFAFDGWSMVPLEFEAA